MRYERGRESLYDVLGVQRGSSLQQVKAAYRKLALETHPDVARGRETSHAQFLRLSEAAQVLTDPLRRAAYDQSMDEALGAGRAHGYDWHSSDDADGEPVPPPPPGPSFTARPPVGRPSAQFYRSKLSPRTEAERLERMAARQVPVRSGAALGARLVGVPVAAVLIGVGLMYI